MLRGLLAAAVVFSSLGLNHPTWACSLAPGADTGVSSPTSGPNPLIAWPDDGLAEPQLMDGGGNPILLMAMSPPTAIGEARGVRNERLRWFRPAAPLSPGLYNLEGRTIDVQSSPPAVTAGRSGTVEFFGSKDEGDPLSEGCGGAEDSCGDLSTFTVTLPEATVQTGPFGFGQRILLTLSDGENVVKWLIQEPFANESTGVQLLIYNLSAPGIEPDRDRVCVSAAGVDGDGNVESAIDLGCTEPPQGGCRSAPPSGVPVFLLLVLALGLGRARAHLRRTQCFCPGL